MKDIFDSFPIAFRMILKDPINLLLAVIPTIMALAIYFFGIVSIYRNTDLLVASFRGYIDSPDGATWLARIASAVLIIFIFVLMSWTFVLVVGLIAAPFNSLLSERIEKKLVQHLDMSQQKIMKEIVQGIWQTFKNEIKKLILLASVGMMAFLLNLFPLFYPIGLFIVACLLAAQFLDYSWSRHNLRVRACLKDMTVNLIPYSMAGFVFLLMITVPIINAFVPALATSYFTVLWIKRQNKKQISQTQESLTS